MNPQSLWAGFRETAMDSSTAAYGVLGLIGLLVYLQRTRGAPKLSLPPGPKPLPILGNFRDVPPEGSLEYMHWLKHKDLYGPITSVTVMGQTIVAIHDKQLAHDVLERESLKTADRPTTEMASQLRRDAAIMSNLAFDGILRYHRKLFHQQMGTARAIEKFRDTQQVESRRLLLNLRKEPDSLLQHIQRVSSGTILRMTYGYSQKVTGMDPLVKTIEEFLSQAIVALTPGKCLVDILPLVKYLPEGCPGTGFIDMIRSLVKNWHAIEDIPYKFVQDQVNNGTNRPSYVSRLLEDKVGNGMGTKLASEDEEAAIKSTAAIMYSGAVETTSLTLSIFVMAMIKFPQVQRKAQEEIDRVVGSCSRLPSFEDQKNLPYVEALITETLRWFPSLPMGFPHMATQDMVAGGYRIPKGACLLPNVHWFTHDPEAHPNPDAFEPERYLSPRCESDPRQYVFGYGRRICPGRHFANASLFLYVAQTLAVFDIGKAVDEEGREIEPELKATPGVISHIEPFAFMITPRSEGHDEMMRGLEREMPVEADDSAMLDLFE